jgi:hypothetical protein
MAKTVSKVLWKPILEVKDDLIGIPIRKSFGAGVWCDGMIKAVTTTTIKSGDDNEEEITTVLCTVHYFQTASTPPGKKTIDISNQETLAVDETLDLWIIAREMMYSIKPSITLELDQPPALFHRKQGRQTSSAPYTLPQFKELMSCMEHFHGGVTIEDLEGSKLILSRNPNSKATHVYGRMLPNAIQVSIF